MRHVAACNNAVLPGRRVRFHVDGQPVGWVLPDAAAVVGTGTTREGMATAVFAGLKAGWLKVDPPRLFALADAAESHRVIESSGASTPLLLVP